MSSIQTDCVDDSIDGIHGKANLSDEISNFWFPQLKKNSWPVRWRLINELCEQIGDDVAIPSVAAKLSARIIADLIVQLDDNPIRSEAQALTYRLSVNENHVAAANGWFATAKLLASDDERRRSRRHLVNREAAVWMQGRKLPGVLVDVSDAGALLECRTKISIGDRLEIRAGWAQTRQATVVRGQDYFFGVQFA